jgi:hypothetical protein
MTMEARPEPPEFLIDVGGVEVHPPVLLEAHDIAQPGHVGLDGEEVGGDVVDDLEAHAVVGVDALDGPVARRERVGGSLHEPEADVAERGRDVEPAVGAALLVGRHWTRSVQNVPPRSPSTRRACWMSRTLIAHGAHAVRDGVAASGRPASP